MPHEYKVALDKLVAAQVLIVRRAVVALCSTKMAPAYGIRL